MRKPAARLGIDIRLAFLIHDGTGFLTALQGFTGLLQDFEMECLKLVVLDHHAPEGRRFRVQAFRRWGELTVVEPYGVHRTVLSRLGGLGTSVGKRSNVRWARAAFG